MAFLKYTAVRLGITAAVLIICLQLGLGWIFSAVVAVVIAFCISYLFLRGMRDAAAESLQHRFSGKAAPLRSSTEREDAAAEDNYVAARGDSEDEDVPLNPRDSADNPPDSADAPTRTADDGGPRRN